jgi:DNA-binding transcriptional LysR family regulator
MAKPPPKHRAPDLSTRQLRAVVAVAENRSFVAAAVELKTSQPALTRTIQQVEALVGVALFSRSTRQVSVTPAGREFVALAERLLAEMRIGLAAMRDLADQRRGQVIIASIMSLGQGVLPALLAGYLSRFPGVEIQLREGVQGQVQEDVRAGLADFGLGYIEDLPPGFTTEPLAREEFHVVLPRDHPLAGQARVRLAALRGERLVSLPPESRTRRLLDGAAAAAGFSFGHGIAVNQFATLYALVRAGAGISVVPGGAGPLREDPELVFRPLAAPRLTRQVGVLRLAERPPSPAAEGLLAAIRQAMRPRRPMRKLEE